MKEPSRREPQRIGDVITDLLARRGYAQLAASEECQTAWRKAVGKLEAFSKATEIKKGVLQVVVANSVVLQELTFRKPELLQAITETLPHHQVSDLRFRVGPVQ